MKKYIPIILLVMFFLSLGSAIAAENNNFGGRGRAWEQRTTGSGTYYGHTRNENLSKDWDPPDGEARFTQPGNAEGQADENSAIRYYPCPNTQVYPRMNGHRNRKFQH